jgi:hypothetical protein
MYGLYWMSEEASILDGNGELIMVKYTIRACGISLKRVEDTCEGEIRV